MDTELAHTPASQAYGHSYDSQFIVLTCCTAAQTRSVPNVALTPTGGAWHMAPTPALDLMTLFEVIFGPQISLTPPNKFFDSFGARKRNSVP